MLVKSSKLNCCNVFNYLRGYRFRVEHYTSDRLFGGLAFFREYEEAWTYSTSMRSALEKIQIEIFTINKDGSTTPWKP